MYADLYPGETENALMERAANPVTPTPKRRGLWRSAGDLLTAPLYGAAQGINESGRLLSRLATMRPEPDPPERQAAALFPPSPQIQEERARSRERNDEIAAVFDTQFRSGADYWRADPATSNWATQLLHEGGRIVAKAAGYGAAGGMPGAVVGTSIDEGATAFLGLRDRGVDAATAAQVGAVRAATTAVSIALPVAGRTAAQTAGLVLAGGPAAYMAEAALSREILQRAQYPEIAAEHDPFDPAGLALSLVPGAVFGTAAHLVRRGAGSADAAAPNAADIETLAATPEAVQAAHVVYGERVLDDGLLVPTNDLAARQAHRRALDEVRAALDEDRPPAASSLAADPVLGRAALESTAQRMRVSPETLAEGELLRIDADEAAVPPTAVTESLTPVGQAIRMVKERTRATKMLGARMSMLVRLEDDGTPARPANEVLSVEVATARHNAAEAQLAHQTAIECALRLGDME